MSAASSMTFRVPADLQAAFIAACKAHDVSASQVLRAAMRDYLAANGQGALDLSDGISKPAGKSRKH